MAEIDTRMQEGDRHVPYRFCTLYSGSEGNAAYLETPGARILIDAGKSARTLTSSLRRLGTTPDELNAIFITHEHRDHVAALEVLTRKHPVPVHMLLAIPRQSGGGALQLSRVIPSAGFYDCSGGCDGTGISNPSR